MAGERSARSRPSQARAREGTSDRLPLILPTAAGRVPAARVSQRVSPPVPPMVGVEFNVATLDTAPPGCQRDRSAASGFSQEGKPVGGSRSATASPGCSERGGGIEGRHGFAGGLRGGGGMEGGRGCAGGLGAWGGS